MKKSFFLAVAAVAMTACSNDVDLGMKDANKQTADNAIGFQVLNSNMSRGTGTQGLEATGHYNFGVFAYKTGATGIPTIMENYLVGFSGTDSESHRLGYKFGDDQTTKGDDGSTTNGQSMWQYEKLGYEDYTYTGAEGYYTQSQKYYMSNWKTQFLRYWDYSSTSTKFYAYAPYIHGTGTSDPIDENVVTFNNSDQKMTFPAGSIVAGYDDPSQYEYLCAYKNVAKEYYSKDVQLQFKHMNSQIRIVFYEDIKGYDVQMLDLKSGANVGVLAVPTTKSGDSYTYCTDGIPKTASTVVTFQDASPFISLGSMTDKTYYTGSAGDAIDGSSINDKALVFKRPTADALKDNKPDAISDTEGSWSKTVYYGIPHDTSCGLTFRVSFKLTSTTDETINVYNAGVHVDAVNCKWEAGKRYTYVFKITKSATGDTGKNNPTVDPDPGTGALFPIVFDGITVEDWAPATESDHNIN